MLWKEGFRQKFSEAMKNKIIKKSILIPIYFDMSALWCEFCYIGLSKTKEKFTFFSSLIFSALFAFRHSTLCDPYRLMNSIESNPLPSDDTNIAELIRARLHRFSMATAESSINGTCCYFFLLSKGKEEWNKRYLSSIFCSYLPKKKRT